jgi:hypothetical protein
MCVVLWPSLSETCPSIVRFVVYSSNVRILTRPEWFWSSYLPASLNRWSRLEIGSAQFIFSSPNAPKPTFCCHSCILRSIPFVWLATSPSHVRSVVNEGILDYWEKVLELKDGDVAAAVHALVYEEISPRLTQS